MFCTECGETLQTDNKFCGNCGHEIEATFVEPAAPAPEQIPVKDSHNNLVTGFLKRYWLVALLLVVGLYMGINAWTARAAERKLLFCMDTIATYIRSGNAATLNTVDRYNEIYRECGAPWHFPSTGRGKYGASMSQMCHNANLERLVVTAGKFHSRVPPTCLDEITQADLSKGGFENLTTDDLAAHTRLLNEYHKVTASSLSSLYECETDLIDMDIAPQRPDSCDILTGVGWNLNLDETHKILEYLQQSWDSVYVKFGEEG